MGLPEGDIRHGVMAKCSRCGEEKTVIFTCRDTIDERKLKREKDMKEMHNVPSVYYGPFEEITAWNRFWKT